MSVQCSAMIGKILKQLGLCQTPLAVTRFPHEEGDGFYNAWRVDFSEASYVLKQVKGKESEIYSRFLNKPCIFAPQQMAVTSFDQENYLLMEYISGCSMMKPKRKDLLLSIDSLIAMQSGFWNTNMESNALESRINRGKYLADSRLERAYAAYLEDCACIPTALCHDDLLPFNVILSHDRAVFIDWEVGGILPYTASIARLFAHADEQEDAFFQMKETDKVYALEYYYARFLKDRGVAYESFLHSFKLALFYEYCEWVYVGNKYADTENDRFHSYFQKATEMAIKLGF